MDTNITLTFASIILYIISLQLIQNSFVTPPPMHSQSICQNKTKSSRKVFSSYNVEIPMTFLALKIIFLFYNLIESTVFYST